MACTRRSYIRTSAAAALGFPFISRLRAANNTVRIGIIGLRSKGKQHLQLFQAMDGVEVTALCDPDNQILRERTTLIKNPAVKKHADMRRVFDDPEIDAVVIATPNHWHALATIWACQAGKDVYVEKPVSHTLHESRLMIQAARKYGRMVQSGTQRRSDAALKQVFAELRGGELGKIERIRVFHYSVRGSIGRVKPKQPAPAHVDYDLWCGPAPTGPLPRKNLHYDWHWQWATGNGELGNNGPHEMDLARWAAGYDTLAPKVFSIGDRYGWNDDGETPNTQIIYYDYAPAPILMEIRNLPAKSRSKTADHYQGLRTGIRIECEQGYFSGMDGGHLYDNEGKKLRQIVGDSGAQHQANFIAAVRSRKHRELNADIADGHLSCGLCHQGNISHRLAAEGNAAKMEPYALSVEAYERMAAHLKANEIAIANQPPAFGAMLEFDTQQERFIDNEAANALLTRTYRAPYTLPDRI